MPPPDPTAVLFAIIELDIFPLAADIYIPPPYWLLQLLTSKFLIWNIELLVISNPPPKLEVDAELVPAEPIVPFFITSVLFS